MTTQQKTPEQLNIDLAFHQARVQSIIDGQRRDHGFAFGIYDAPSSFAEKRCFDDYWAAEERLQEHLFKIVKIKEELRS